MMQTVKGRHTGVCIIALFKFIADSATNFHHLHLARPTLRRRDSTGAPIASTPSNFTASSLGEATNMYKITTNLKLSFASCSPCTFKY